MEQWVLVEHANQGNGDLAVTVEVKTEVLTSRNMEASTWRQSWHSTGTYYLINILHYVTRIYQTLCDTHSAKVTCCDF
jgi:hypothetical protein